MKSTLSAVIAVACLGAGCASVQESRMYSGPFGRTEVGAFVVAADPASSKVLVQSYDGDLWIYDVDSTVGGRLSTLRVGDEVILAFDDRIAGKRAIALSVVAPGRRPMPPGTVSVAAMLPAGVVFGAPATSPATMSGTRVAAGVPLGAGGVIVAGPGGSTFVGGTPVFSGPGVIAPGFGGFSALPAGVLAPQAAMGLGIVPNTVTSTGLAPMGGPSLGTIGEGPGRSPFTQGNFTPGTIAPGVTTANPNSPGSAVVQGPFTPGTVAPGVSQQRGNAAPPAAGATNTGTPPRQTMTRGTPASSAAPVVNGVSVPGAGIPPGMTTIPGTTTFPGQPTVPGQTTTGQPVNPQGQPVNPQGQPVNPQGQPVTPQGQPVTPQGQAVAPRTQGGVATPQGQAAPQGRPAAPTGSIGGSPQSN